MLLLNALNLCFVEFEDTPTCPKILSLFTIPAPHLPTRSLFWLVTNRSTRKLTFSGKPSLFSLSRKGKPSILRLLRRGRPSLLKLLTRGKPSVLRLLLTGEENERSRFSLFRLLCHDTSFSSIPGRSLLQVLFEVLHLSRWPEGGIPRLLECFVLL